VLTHSHFDHVGGAYEFEARVAHPTEEAEMRAPRGFRGLTREALGEDVVSRLTRAGYRVPATLLTALPYEGYRLQGYEVKSAPLSGTVEDGHVIDLGDRAFSVLHLPGHSPGGIGLWEAKTGILFSGDAVYDGPLLYDLPGSSVEAYVATLERLLALDVATVHAGHDPSFGRARLGEIARDYLTRLRAVTT
jgi:glyoxylase-like metal-dependent hydrolase (beta-lactamase superfamily II)